MSRKIIFTPPMEKFIHENYLLMSRNDMAKKLLLDEGVIGRYMKNVGLTVPKEVKESIRASKLIGRTNFTKADDDYIKQHYLTKPIKALGEDIGRSYTGVMGAIKRLGLVLPPEVIQRNRDTSRFAKGHVSFNTGKKQTEYMTSEQIAATERTRFKKGNISHTAYEHDGIVTIRRDHPNRAGKTNAYKYIRVALGKWEPLHVHIWEAANGKVPKKYCVAFRDGDSMNCELENLELISRRELAIRNNGNINLTDEAVSRYMATSSRKIDVKLQQELLNHPDLIELKRGELLLSRSIKQLQYGTKK